MFLLKSVDPVHLLLNTVIQLLVFVLQLLLICFLNILSHECFQERIVHSFVLSYFPLFFPVFVNPFISFSLLDLINFHLLLELLHPLCFLQNYNLCLVFIVKRLLSVFDLILSLNRLDSFFSSESVLLIIHCFESLQILHAFLGK